MKRSILVRGDNIAIYLKAISRKRRSKIDPYGAIQSFGSFCLFKRQEKIKTQNPG